MYKFIFPYSTNSKQFFAKNAQTKLAINQAVSGIVGKTRAGLIKKYQPFSQYAFSRFRQGKNNNFYG